MSVCVTMRAGSERYALTVDSVAEITELGLISPVPGAGGSVLGVRNLRGRVLPVFDLATVLGIASERPQRLVVAELGDRSAGLAVAEVSDVGDLDGDLQATDSDLLAGTMLSHGAMIGVLDAARLFAALELSARP